MPFKLSMKPPRGTVARSGPLLPKYPDGLRISQTQVITKCLGRKSVNFGNRMAFYYQAKCTCGAINEYTQDSIRVMLPLNRKRCKHCFMPTPRPRKILYTKADLDLREDVEFLKRYWDPATGSTASLKVNMGWGDWVPK